jgi:tetratricopeptide (TPR) repeat protein
MTLRCSVGLLVLCIPLSGFSQDRRVQQASSASTNPTDPDRIKAMDLYAQHRLPEVVPLLVSVLERYPGDVVAHERLGVSLISKADVDADPEQAKADLIRARQELLKARSLGDNSDLLNTLLEIVPENGERATFSPRAAVDAAMHRGEGAFAQGKFEDALREYAAAYELDPKLYMAAGR